jgi:hypothetical protein
MMAGGSRVGRASAGTGAAGAGTTGVARDGAAASAAVAMAGAVPAWWRRTSTNSSDAPAAPAISARKRKPSARKRAAKAVA